jgi:LysM repeat protein
VRGGSDAQLYFSFFATHNGGLYQQVSGVPAGAEVTFSVYAYLWSSSLSDPNASEQDGGLTLRVGVDPTGGTDPSSAGIVWSDFAQQYDAYRQYSVTVESTDSVVTVFIQSSVSTPVEYSAVFLDDASLTIAGSVAPTVTNTQVAVVPTFTVLPATVTSTVSAPVGVTATQAATGTSTQIVAPTFTALPATATEAAPPASPTQLATVTEASTATATQIIAPTFTPLPVTPTATQAPPTPSPIPSNTPVPRPTVDTITFPGTVIHTVRAGDTVARLATQYGSTTQAIISANGLGPNALIFVGQGLVIPVRATGTGGIIASATPQVIIVTATAVPAQVQPTAPPTQIALGPGIAASYTVAPGDTLLSIAARFRTSVVAIARLNGIVNPNRILVGQTLLIPATGTPPAAPTPTPTPPPLTYTVAPGDTLFRISLRFNVPLLRLIQINGIVNPNVIFVGQVLRLS